MTSVSLRALYFALAKDAIRRAWELTGREREQAIADALDWALLGWRTPPDVRVPSEEQTTWQHNGEVSA